MPLINWSNNYSVKISSIDEQHKILINMINDFHDGMNQKKSKEAMVKLFDGLIAYTKTHFTFEEKLFDKFGYPEKETHKIQHKKLIEQVMEKKERFSAGKMLLNIEVMNFLRDWIMNHIKGTDTKYTGFFHSKGYK